MGTAARVRVTVEDAIGGIGRGAWERLAAGAPAFYGHAFLRSIEERPLTAGSKAFYLVARDGAGEPAAVLPLYLAHTADPFAADPDAPAVRILAGHMWHCYDTVLPSRLPVGPGLVGPLWEALADLAADTGADTWGLVNIPLGGELASALEGIGLELQETTPRYRLPRDPGPASVDDHLAGVGRSSRRTMRLYRRRAADAGAVVRFDTPDRALRRDVLDLCLATADKHAPGYYPPDELEALLRALGEDCRILRLELDGTLLAASICLLDRRSAHFWAGGSLYPDELNWSPQYVLFAAEMEAGLGTGRPVLEFGRRNDEFKTRYGLRQVRLGRVVG
ncbi:GNAT family N-acetyltransferase [Nocardiopsis sp. RSe5-2]|uniref:GNAT family N-acetyltransferase n=1 Tax=Nocardiopsis endophytica TaxID=3018445 RepID=A0ABT4U9C9_9ACTN|nr:GNAT family N-acetyltransferase [Nocardiopsis endophytica]MDA2813555.1 GNAT family N-acetyltransferase [Nocardiopsis endophytica]